MGILNITAVLAVSLAGLLPAGCNKTTTQANNTGALATSGVATNLVARDLGNVSLTNHCETCLPLGAGQNFCTLTPKMLDRHNVQITLSVESKTAAGRTRDLSVTQVVTRTDRPLEVAVGNFNVTLTPHVSLD